jgi:PTH1 family peptidyl-tRNA hydrolase
MNYVIVGLGNPGSEYENTRHNAGRMMLEAFAKANDFSEWTSDKKLKALVSTGKLATGNPPERAASVRAGLKLILPETFMNKSGESVKNLQLTTHNLQLGKKKTKEITNLVVVHDDLDIPFGKFKISFNKSSGGHRGVESIIKTLKTQAFTRIRVGIAASASIVRKSQEEAVVDKIILGKFKPAELVEFKKLSKSISEALSVIATEGREVAMSRQGSF